MKTPAIIRRLFRPEVKGLADPSADLYALFGITPTATGAMISAADALRVPAVASAVRVISEAVACLDLGIKEIGSDGVETDVTDHPARALLRGAANEWTSGYELIRDLVIDALTDDRGGMVWVNRVGGAPFELIRYRSGVMSVDYDASTGEPTYRRTGALLPIADVIHLKSPFGRSPLSMARDAIAVASVLERHAARLFGKGARPSGALMFPKGMGEESVKRARGAWQSTHEAEGESGKTAILYDGAEFKPFTFASTDAQFLENRKFQITEIARAFRVPPSMLFDMDRATWSNTEQMGKEFLTYCLEPWLRAAEGALNRAMFSGDDRGRLAVRFDRDDLTRADLSTRATVINSLTASRVINPNEGRAWLGLQPYAGGEAFVNPNIQNAPDQSGATDPAQGGGDATE